MKLGGSRYMDVDGNWYTIEYYAEVKKFTLAMSRLCG